MPNIIINISKYVILFSLTYLIFLNLTMYHSNSNDFDVKSIREVTTLASEVSALALTPKTIPIHPQKQDRVQPKRVVHRSIWESIRKEFKLNGHVNSKEVQKEIKSLMVDKNRLTRILQSASPYMYYIFNQTKSNHLPGEIVLVPMIESEFNPYDKSNKGATGIWQLMSVTAQQLGVSVKQGYDGRRNIVASTKAALAYFKDLGVLFHGNWYLAIAAYNSGQKVVLNATRKAGHKNFWQLKLPKETKIYVPRLLALAEIINHPDKYHIKLPHISNTPYFATLETKKNINLKHMANLTGTNIDMLTRLNPDYTKGSHPTHHHNKIFLVPIDSEKVAKNYLMA